MIHCPGCTWRAGMPVVIALVTLLGFARPAHAQTDYYNTDAGRPVTIEDAYTVERRAIELQLAPLRLERSRAGHYQWQLEPEVAFGILPRTQAEIAFPIAYLDRGLLPHERGLAGIELSALYNLNAETRIPAFAIAGELLAPVGPLAPADPLLSVTAIATRTFPALRVHVNARYTAGGDDADADAHAGELTRWLAGVAVDRVLPLRSMLLTAELVALKPLHDEARMYWQSGAGVRYQLSPRVASDLGAGFRAVPGAGSWYVTMGTAIALGLPWRP